MLPKPYHCLGAVGLLCSLLTACASKVPIGLRHQIPNAPMQGQVQSEPEHYLGREVRWGGEILGLRNGTQTTEVEIFGRALFDDGEPRPDGGDGVRFIARVRGFLDPAEYRPDKRMTVRGRLDAAVTRPVGEFPYLYPVVNVEVFHLWPKFEPPPPAIWVRDPFFDPLWPWRPYPHRPHRR